MLNTISLIGRNFGIQQRSNKNNYTSNSLKLNQLNADTVSFSGNPKQLLVERFKPETLDAIEQNFSKSSADYLKEAISKVEGYINDIEATYVEEFMNHVTKKDPSLAKPISNMLKNTEKGSHPKLLINLAKAYKETLFDTSRPNSYLAKELQKKYPSAPKEEFNALLGTETTKFVNEAVRGEIANNLRYYHKK